MCIVRVLLSGILLLGAAGSAAAQVTAPRLDLFGGYSLLPADPEDDFPRRTSHGAQMSVTVHLTRWFGIVGDFGIQFDTSRDLGPGFEGLVARTVVREYLAGPRFTARSESVDIFAHGLIGVADGDAGEFAGFSDRKLAFGGGAGFDVRVSRRAAVRAQFDLIGSFADIVEGNTRFGAGVVLALGQMRR